MTKTFDCVEMKRQGAARIYDQTKDLTFAQQVAFWRRRSEEFRLEQEQLLAGEKASPSQRGVTDGENAHS